MSEGNYSSPFDDLSGNPITEPLVESSDESLEELEIDVVDDRPEKDRVAPRDPARSVPIEDVDDTEPGPAGGRLSRLKYEYHEERREKEAAERMREEAIRYAQQVAKQNEELRAVLVQGENVLVDEMRQRARGDLEKARADYKVAYEEGNTDALLKAQEDLNRFQRQSELAESQGTIVPGHLQQGTPPPPTAAQPPPDPKLSEWMGKNEWFGQDQEMTSFAYGVHHNLVQSGVDPRSEDYYAKLDMRVREVFPEKFGNGKAMETPVAGSQTTVVAPANRSSGKPRRVQLTSTQVALAKRLGLTPEQYAKQLLKEMR